jgi:hypothetical protein
MSGHDDVRADIISRLERLGALDRLADEMPGTQRGNGWDPSGISEAVVRIVPQPLEKLGRKAVRPGISRRIGELFRPRYATSRLAGQPTFVYLPLGHVKGYHELFYLRNADYKVRVENDVVAVEVDGETRDLIIEEQESKIVPDAFLRRLKDFSKLFTGERKYFSLNNAIELAVRYARGEMYFTSDGREGDVLEEVLPGSWRIQRVFDSAQLNVAGTATMIASSKETKETVMERFRERLVKMPESCRKVLSNTFQVEEMTQYYVPYVYFPVVRGGKVDHVIINAASAEIPDERDVKFVKRQLDL